MDTEPLDQACAIPWRDGPNGREFCVITSLKRGNWGFPKGIVDPGDTPPVSALKEAWEEAGVKGMIVGDAFGTYGDFKWGRTLTVHVFSMRVTEEAETWPEGRLRRRAWVPADEALRILSNPHQREFLRRFTDS